MFRLGDQNEVGRFRDNFREILQSHRKLVDAHHAFAAAEINRTQSVANQDAGSIFFRGMNRIFKIQNDGVRAVQSGVDYGQFRGRFTVIKGGKGTDL